MKEQKQKAKRTRSIRAGMRQDRVEVLEVWALEEVGRKRYLVLYARGAYGIYPLYAVEVTNRLTLELVKCSLTK